MRKSREFQGRVFRRARQPPTACHAFEVTTRQPDAVTKDSAFDVTLFCILSFPAEPVD